MLAVAIFLGVVVFLAVWLAVGSQFVGIYAAHKALEDAIGRWVTVRSMERIRGERVLAFYDAAGGTHAHFYGAIMDFPTGSERVTLFRYYPDALGRPFGDKLHGAPIAWQPVPVGYGFLLAGKCRVLRPWRLIYLPEGSRPGDVDGPDGRL
jgi:hypothetical protein